MNRFLDWVARIVVILAVLGVATLIGFCAFLLILQAPMVLVGLAIAGLLVWALERVYF